MTGIHKIIQPLHPIVVGLLLGWVQSGLLIQLSLTLTSSYGTYLLITLSWLIGSMLGVTIMSRFYWRLKWFLLLLLIGYGTISVLLMLLPFRTDWWYGYAVVIVVIGFYPGAFFERMSKFYPARVLFFRENNGFVIGLLSAAISFMLVGRLVLWIIPLGLALYLFAVPDTLFHPRRA